jgi:hypothetical protein
MHKARPCLKHNQSKKGCGHGSGGSKLKALSSTLSTTKQQNNNKANNINKMPDNFAVSFY